MFHLKTLKIMDFEILYSNKKDNSYKSHDSVKKLFSGFNHPEKIIQNNLIEERLQKINLHEENKIIGALRIDRSGKIKDVNSVAINLYHISSADSLNSNIGDLFYINNKPVSPAMLDLIIDEQIETPIIQLNNGFQKVQVKMIVFPFDSPTRKKEYMLLFYCNN